jgi:hypothetical protein
MLWLLGPLSLGVPREAVYRNLAPFIGCPSSVSEASTCTQCPVYLVACALQGGFACSCNGDAVHYRAGLYAVAMATLSRLFAL